MSKFFNIPEGPSKGSFISIDDIEAVYLYYENDTCYLYAVLHSGKELCILSRPQSEKINHKVFLEEVLNGK